VCCWWSTSTKIHAKKSNGFVAGMENINLILQNTNYDVHTKQIVETPNQTSH
jgi:hypothetical protein